MADLWVRDRLRTTDFKLSKVAGADNPADALTKHLTRQVLDTHMAGMNIKEEQGRSEIAPQISKGDGGEEEVGQVMKPVIIC